MHDLKEALLSKTIDELQEEFKEQGYLFIRSFFLEDAIQQARNRVIDILYSEGWGTYKDNTFIAIEPVNRINSAPFHQCITHLMKQELLHELSEYPSLINLLNDLLGEPIFPHPRKMIRITYPYHLNPKDRVPPHQDLFYVKGERDTFTAWIPLGNYPPEQGGLLVAPGTHKLGLFPTQSNDEGRFGCNAIEDHLTDFTWCKAHYKPGDLLLMHSLTLHQSGKNDSNQFRLSLDCRFSSALQNINEDQLLPPYHPHIPDWEFLTQGWKKKNRFIPPTTIKIQKKDEELIKILRTPTRFAT